MKLTRSERMKKQWTPERRERHSQRMKELWACPGYRKKMAQLPKRPRPKQSEYMKKKWANPDYREKQSKRAKEGWEDPELREKASKRLVEQWKAPEYREKMSKMWEAPAFREKMSKRAKEQWEDPELREKQSKRNKKRCADPVVRQKMSKISKERWEDSTFRERMSGENSHLWQGGISRLPYSFDFNDELKKMIKARDGFQCVLCETWKPLRVHHINYDKMDSRPENLITLCVSCHTKTNYNRDYWEAFLTTLIEQKEPLSYPLVDIEPLSLSSPYSIIGGVDDGA